MFENTCIYEVNVRQMTPEGTFKALLPELDRWAAMGVGVLWFMPIQPIGLLHRKGALGSYYAVADYVAINPEFGSLQDFINVVDKAHSLGMKVLLDWVANHTAPDHVWTKHSDWHKRDSTGNLAVQYDWTDITELNYQNADMRRAMIEAMHFWVETAHIDGFRCDMAMLVPTDFWREAIASLRRDRSDLFFLAEAEQADLLHDGLFDAYYAWKLHHTLNAVAQGSQNAQDIWQVLEFYRTQFPAQAMPMAFTSNHDENSHSGSEFERMGEAALSMAALTFLLPTWPLLYTGQEQGNRKRLAFFEKDCIDNHQSSLYTAFYKSWITARQKYPFLSGGITGAPLDMIGNDRPTAIFSFKRKGPDASIYAIFNLSNAAVDFGLYDQDFDSIEICPLGSDIPKSLPKRMRLNPWCFEVWIGTPSTIPANTQSQ